MRENRLKSSWQDNNKPALKIAGADRSMIMKVMMPVIIKSNVLLFVAYRQRSCYMSNDN
jgi:hypothetical protein